ncbi:succinate dehydrogenase [Chloropicon primus]|uniref:Succinate dehydrogenase [ubiquinone] cytochrome b small subunit n=1 Tax=Chloropicon primus TaxID=1764295 RepID=A0A5B8MCW5_9CHLO|nr:succinate dehydrogenase [ubiquinone] cytochrome b [Chloropicon primus]UPQ97246.1 succinate dehydrogenase [Chloropicon primus]|eukprot:QDZ18031.1 succinate dehydrogenase [ubiquinone] cytochrome b [Chloropicon primus]
MSWLLRAADSAPGSMKVHHMGNVALAALTPAAAFLPKDSGYLFPVDLALGVALPLHSHITMNMVFSDYVPPGMRGIARGGMAGVTALTVMGLLHLNLRGPGLTSCVKQLWCNSAASKDKK